jgi:type I restriction enzyme R subunit
MEQSLKIEDGLPGKTIIFAMNQAHAEHLREAFEAMYPHLHDFAVVITSNVEKADELLKDFKKLKTEKKFRVAISVDMLDTGVDVPEVVNLVFARKVFSEAKFWQMVGRGTRLCPGVFGENGDKTHFLILDFAMNFDEEHVFKDPNGNQLSVQQKCFEARIAYLKLLEHREDRKRFEPEKSGILAMARDLYETGNDEIFERKALFESVMSGKIFDNVAVNPYDELQKIAPLLRYYDRESIDELRFSLKTARFKSALLKNDDTEGLRLSIARDIHSLPESIGAVSEKGARIREILSPKFWQDATLETIEALGTEFAPLMKYRKPARDIPLAIDEPDDIIERRWIEYAEGKKMASDKYWEVFVGELEHYAKSSKAIKKILNDEPITSDDLAELERLFQQSEYRITLSNLRRAYGRPTVAFEQLVKVALGKASMPEWETEVSGLFDEYVRENNFTSQQIRFLQIVKAVIIQKKFIVYEDLYGDTFEKAFGMGAFERLFRQKEQDGVWEFVGRFGLG